MCGISGIIQQGRKVNPLDHNDLQKMLQNVWHRGPDQMGTYTGEQLLLGSQRLKLLDLSEAGSLPMQDEAGEIIISFNGEISNYLELIEKFDLKSKYRFHSATDTEVVIYLYRELGIECLKQLSGMFAFILYDRRSELVYLVRDFYGINPLFYIHAGQTWYVASEIKSLENCSGFNPALNVQGLYDLYTLAYIPGTKTPYQEIHELGPGTFLEINLKNQSHRSERYYQFKFKRQEMSEKVAIEKTREVLLTSVERHLRSDAPIGAMCSGGIDTSSLVGMVKHLGKARNFHTFSLSIQDAAFDESHFQKVVAQYAGTEHHQINVGLPDIIEHFYDHLAFMDEPYGHGAALPTYLLAREARKHVKGLLSGEGGDELFNAYETHGAHFWRNIYHQVPSPLRKVASVLSKELPVSLEKLSLDFKLKRFFDGAELPIHQSHLYWRHVLKDGMKQELFVKPHLPTFRLSQELFLDLGELDDFSKLSAWDIEYFFFSDLMVKNDRMCLAHSVESRFPYMDRIVTDFVFSVPSEYKIKGARRRHLQKEAMKPFLPEVIYDRAGFGLELPYNKWFLGDLKILYQQYFNEDFFQYLPFLNWKTFKMILEYHQEKRIDQGRFLWTTLILCAWYDIHFVKKNAQALRESVHQKRDLAL